MVLNSHSDNQNGFRSASRIQELVLHSQIPGRTHECLVFERYG